MTAIKSSYPIFFFFTLFLANIFSAKPIYDWHHEREIDEHHFEPHLSLKVPLDVPPSLQIPEKHELDEREYRRFVLKNGLKVLLISDPKLNRSSAALDVDVGSLSDPRELQGLCHFLEHMLFLGTKKYPKVGEYSSFIRDRDGYSNAYTAGFHTNYQFEIHHDYFDEALDRFAQFFISPLLDPEYIEKEVNAVHSEHQKNLLRDNWRQWQLLRSLFKKDHPANHFGTGNKKTLAKANRKALMKFYQKHYSANRMALVLVGQKSLDELEKMARSLFSKVKNRKLDQIRFDSEYLPRAKGQRVIRLIPVKDLRRLSLEFPLPGFAHHYESKPGQMLGYILGHEGEGSLLHFLKQRGYATGLSAGAYSNTRDYGSFTISVDLTPQGLENWKAVAQDCFSYIQLMKQSGYPSHIWSEIKTMKQLSWVYGQKLEGAGYASRLAADIHLYNLEVAERVGTYLTKQDPKVYFDLLNHLVPENSIALIQAKGLETDLKEPIYGTQYSYALEKEDFYKSLIQAQPQEGMIIPEANPFVPAKVEIYKDRPRRVLKEPGLELWVLKDRTFKRPKVTKIFRFKIKEKGFDVRKAVLLNYYTACIREQLNELSYPARLAGLSFSTSWSPHGLYVSVRGYDSSAQKLLEEVTRRLTRIELSQDRYNAIVEKTTRSWKNFELEAAWTVSRSYSRKLRRDNYFVPKELLEASKSIGFHDLKAFARDFFSEYFIESFIHGNIQDEQAIQSAQSVIRILKDQLSSTQRVRSRKQARRIGESPLGALPMQNTKFVDQRMLRLEPGHRKVFIGELETDNSCLYQHIHLGLDDRMTRAKAMILSNFVTQPYYFEMRTQQQLGYIVWGVANRDEDSWQMFFIIQSGEYDAKHLAQQSDQFIATLPQKFREISDEDFETLKQSAINSLKEKSKSISEEANKLFSLIYHHDAEFDRNEKDIEAILNLKKSDVVELLEQALDPKTSRGVKFLMSAKGKKVEIGAQENSIEDFKDYLKTRTYR